MLSIADPEIKHHSSCGGSQFKFKKSLVLDQNCSQEQTIKDLVDKNHCVTSSKHVQISAYVVTNRVSKIEGKKLIFKASVAGIKTRLPVDNGSKAELIDKFFVRTNKISIFKLKAQIRLEIGNREMMEWLEKACLIDLQIGDHQKQLLTYVANLDAYSVVLRDSWLQQHNPAIDWRN